MVDEVGPLLRHLFGYNSVSFLKPATPLRLLFQKTGHLTQTVGRSLQNKRFHSKNVREDLLRTLKTLHLQGKAEEEPLSRACLLYTSPSPRDA